MTSSIEPFTILPSRTRAGSPVNLYFLKIANGAYSSSRRLIARHKVVQQREQFYRPLDDLVFQFAFLDQFDLPVGWFFKFSHVAVYSVRVLTLRLFSLIHQQFQQS